MKSLLFKWRPQQRSVFWYLMLLLTAAMVPAAISAYLSVNKADLLQKNALKQSRERARKDLQREMSNRSRQLLAVASRLASWDETRALFADATYYNYWKQARVAELSARGDKIVESIDLYNKQGLPLTPDVSLASKVDKAASTQPAIVKHRKKVYLSYFHPVIDKSAKQSRVIGYIGLRIDIKKLFDTHQVLDHYSIDSIKWELKEAQSVPVFDAIRILKITVMEPPEVKVLVGLVRSSLWKYMFYVFLLIVTSAILFAVFIGRPLLRLASHLQDDDSNSPGRISSAIHGPVRIRELDNVSQALNDYKDRFQSAVVTLEQTNKELLHLTFHDPLTGCANRRAFERRLKHAMEVVALGVQKHALCYLDVDQFKVVNDTCGHIAGDELLKQIAGLLESEIRTTDLLARLGGDEFGVLLEGCEVEAAIKIAENMRLKIKQHRFVWHGQSFDIGVSIGLVPITREIPNMSEALKNADAACYVAKDAGRNRLHVYEENDKEMAKRYGEMQWVTRIKQALEEGQFELYGQLIKPLKIASTDLHYEVLLRLIEQDGKLILPMAFIPAAERYNLMTTIDLWVVKNSIKLMAESIPRVGVGDVHLSINLSGQSIGDPLILECIKQSIEEYGVTPEYLHFEITETAAIANLRQAVLFIDYLRKLGCRFVLDDFGSGLSSFGYISNLEVDSIKIDGYFIKNIHSDPLSKIIISAINEIGHVLGISTIAEFAEDDDIIEELRGLNVDCAQGMGIHKPEPLAHLLESGPSFLVSNAK